MFVHILALVLWTLLYKVTTEVEFSFNDAMYLQVDGVAKGLPLGPVFANIFVRFCEAKVDQQVVSFCITDLLMTPLWSMNSCNESRDFYILNGLHPVLRFTVEAETIEQIPFMYVLVLRHTDTLVRSVFQEADTYQLYTHWDSVGRNQQQILLIKSLSSSRAVWICFAVAL